jgi:hypothetical protein
MREGRTLAESQGDHATKASVAQLYVPVPFVQLRHNHCQWQDYCWEQDLSAVIPPLWIVSQHCQSTAYWEPLGTPSNHKYHLSLERANAYESRR